MEAKRMSESAKRSKGTASIGRAFALALLSELAKAATASHAEIGRSLRNLEKDYVKQLRGHPDLSLEIRRRIAEQLLDQAVLRGSNFSVCRARFNAASKLGFTNLEQKAHYHLLYAKGSFARGHKRVANRVAVAIANDLEQSVNKRKSLLAQECLAHTKKFLDLMKSDGSQLEK